MKTRFKVGAAVAVVAVAVSGGVAYSASIKPNYILPVGSGVEIKPIAYTADKITNTIVRGVPDGMGAYKNAAGDVTLLSVHEIASYAPLAQEPAASALGKAAFVQIHDHHGFRSGGLACQADQRERPLRAVGSLPYALDHRTLAQRG